MSLFLSALQQTNHTQNIPIWIMRQVGRYLPEYHQLKKNRSLFNLFHDEEFIIEATLLAPKLLNVDAAILFSDILIILNALNIPYCFHEKLGPIVNFDPLKKIIKTLNPSIFLPQLNAIRELKKQLTIPLIGFAGSPFTIASYLLEKKPNKDLLHTRRFMYAETDKFENLLDEIVEATIYYLETQILAGIDAIQLFDSATNTLPESLFFKYCIKINKKIISHLKKFSIPIILFTRNSSYNIRSLMTTGANCLSLDWLKDLKKIIRSFPKNLSIQGNMDPMMLFANDLQIKKYLNDLLPLMKEHPGYIFNLGHGIHPQTPVDKIKLVIDYVRSKS